MQKTLLSDADETLSEERVMRIIEQSIYRMARRTDGALAAGLEAFVTREPSRVRAVSGIVEELREQYAMIERDALTLLRGDLTKPEAERIAQILRLGPPFDHLWQIAQALASIVMVTREEKYPPALLAEVEEVAEVSLATLRAGVEAFVGRDQKRALACVTGLVGEGRPTVELLDWEIQGKDWVRAVLRMLERVRGRAVDIASLILRDDLAEAVD